MKAHALVPALALAAALVLPPLAEAGHRHGPGCGHRGHYSDGYDRGHRHGHGYSSRPHRYGYEYPRYRPYSRRYYGYSYAPVPYGYGYYGYGYEAPYGHYSPPPPRRPRLGIGLYFGF